MGTQTCGDKCELTKRELSTFGSKASKAEEEVPPAYVRVPVTVEGSIRSSISVQKVLGRKLALISK